MINKSSLSLRERITIGQTRRLIQNKKYKEIPKIGTPKTVDVVLRVIRR